MKRLLSILSVLSVSSAGHLHAAERVALVIGNDAYQHARPLKAAVNDATAIATSLQKLGFDTITASNAGLEQMVEAMETLKTKAAGAQAVLVYYAGHGIEAQGANFLIPVDAKLEKEVQLQTQAVNLSNVLDKLTALNVPARMVILDCCRDNPLEGRTWLATRSSGGDGLGELPVQNLPAATLVVYAASPGKPALDRVGPTDAHSPFTQALLDTLPEPGVHSFEVFGRVEEAVLTRTEGRQSPRVFYNGSTLPFRNFTFAAASSSPPSQPTVIPSAPMVVQDSPPATTAPPSLNLALPTSGYFDLDGLFSEGPYSKYNRYSRSQILKKAQGKLKEAGFYNRGADGQPGPETQKALIAWQQKEAITMTGKLDPMTLSRLELSDVQPMSEPVRPPLTARPSSGSRKAKPNTQSPSGVQSPTPAELLVRRAVGL